MEGGRESLNQPRAKACAAPIRVYMCVCHLKQLGTKKTKSRRVDINPNHHARQFAHYTKNITRLGVRVLEKREVRLT